MNLGAYLGGMLMGIPRKLGSGPLAKDQNKDQDHMVKTLTM